MGSDRAKAAPENAANPAFGAQSRETVDGGAFDLPIVSMSSELFTEKSYYSIEEQCLSLHSSCLHAVSQPLGSGCDIPRHRCQLHNSPRRPRPSSQILAYNSNV
jgi:hypothetical protein